MKTRGIILVIIIVVGLTGGLLLGMPEKEIVSPHVPLTTVEIRPDTLYLGRVSYQDKKEIVFDIKNTGTAPLIIREIRPSCGCTEVTWKKKPVRPGQNNTVRVVFKPNSLGQFLKNITVICNIEEKIQTVVLKGLVDE